MSTVSVKNDATNFTNALPSIQKDSNSQSKPAVVKENEESALGKNVSYELGIKCCDNDAYVKVNTEPNIQPYNICPASKTKMITKKKKILKSAKNGVHLKKVKHETKPISDKFSSIDSEALKGAVENTSDLLLSCQLCKTSFETLETFKNHKCDTKKVNSNFKMYRCKYCSVSFTQKHHLDRHVKSHKRNNCTVCNEMFTKRKALCKHLKTEHNIVEPEKIYQCTFCDKHFSKRQSLNAHLKNHADGRYFCLKCGFMCDTENVYNDHIEEHIKNSKYECSLCNKKFRRRQQYDQHMMGHERHSCTLCNITFSTKKLFLKHQQTIHGVHVLQKKHACPICKKLFLRPKHLQMHQRKHTGEKPVKCSHCEKSFCNERTLSKHMKSARHLQRVGIVEIEKPFLCSECGARFYQQQSLFRHVEVVHHASQSFNCPHCEYNTKCKANLKRHLELHTDIKRFICEICGSSFRAFATLKEHHTFIHSENRSFICDICKKGFKSKSSLQRHMKIHSEVRPYKCHCNRAYKRMSHLKRHMVSAHNMTFKKNQIPIISKSTNISNQNNSFALSETFEALTDQSSSDDFTLLTISNSNMPKDLNDSESKNLAQQLPTTPTDNFPIVSVSSNISNKLNDSIDENINKQLPGSSTEDDKYADVPSDTMQMHKSDHITTESSPQNTLISIISSPLKTPIYLQTDHHNSISLDDHNLNLSPPNYCNFNLPSSPLGSIAMDNVASTLQQSIVSQDVLSFSSSADSLIRPHSLPNFQNQTSGIDSFSHFSLHNSDSPTSMQLPPFLLSGDISSPPHVNDLNLENNASKQFFGDSDDILSLPPYTTSNELNSSNCTSEHLFSSARDLELWDAGDNNNRIKISGSELNAISSCANTSFSTHLTCNTNNLLAHNLMFSNDSLMVCSLDANTLNPEFDSLSNLC